MTNTKPDPLGISDLNEKHWADKALCERYYFPFEARSNEGTYARLVIDGHAVTDWHQSFIECYAELADKIRQWEAENPEHAIKVNQ